ncbi:DUF4287 domain-containing protein [Flavobacterium sp. HNIBRBA15423]
MSFQAYIDNIKIKTGKSPEDFKRLAEQKGFLKIICFLLMLKLQKL